MKKLSFILHSSAVIFGFFILTVSLMAANQVISYEGVSGSQRKFYVGETILPDHVLYPFVAAADRALLAAAPPLQKIELQLAYGQIRLEYAQGLLEKGEQDMAQAALTKSQKYHSLAAQQLCDMEDGQNLRQKTIQYLAFNLEAAEKIITQLEPHKRSLPNQLQQQNRVLLQKLLEL